MKLDETWAPRFRFILATQMFVDVCGWPSQMTTLNLTRWGAGPHRGDRRGRLLRPIGGPTETPTPPPHHHHTHRHQHCRAPGERWAGPCEPLRCLSLGAGVQRAQYHGHGMGGGTTTHGHLRRGEKRSNRAGRAGCRPTEPSYRRVDHCTRAVGHRKWTAWLAATGTSQVGKKRHSTN